MLKGIPNILTPELFKLLMEIGHGDEIVFTDGNFPIESYAMRVIRADGTDMIKLLEAALKFFPLDTYAEPVHLMEKVKDDNNLTPIWETYNSILKEHTKSPVNIWKGLVL